MRPRTAAATIAASLVLPALLSGCSLGPLGDDATSARPTKTFLEPMNQEIPGRTVVYEVRGPGTATVRYEARDPGDTAETRMRTDETVQLPWKKTVKVPEDTSKVTLTATSPADHTATPLACTVLVDSKLAGSDSVDTSHASCTTELPER